LVPNSTIGDVATLPANYPHGCTDDEILEGLTALGQEILQTGGEINVVLRLSPLVTIGQNELQARRAKQSGEELRAAIDVFRTSSEKACGVRKVRFRLGRCRRHGSRLRLFEAGAAT
jgi:hypothetical protein